MMTACTIVWLRQDLRLVDNPALHAAAVRGKVLPVYILDDDSPGPWRMGGAQRWWLHHSLQSLAKALAKKGMPLWLKKGDPRIIFPALCQSVGADAVYWNRRYTPWGIAVDKALKESLKEAVEVRSFNGSLLFEPWEVKTGEGNWFKVFTPYWKKCLAQVEIGDSLPVPGGLKSPEKIPEGDRLEDWHLLPTKPDWAGGFRETWQPGEAGAGKQLERFLVSRLSYYADKRDVPVADATSGLSPFLHVGEVSPRQIWCAVHMAAAQEGHLEKPVQKFLSELGWREFSYHLLYHFPELPELSFRREFNAFPWEQNDRYLLAWQKGQTGIPIVDAGMRELWHTGVMHNRARMLAASFLTKNLLIHWREGADWFWDTLVDADLANNSASWQWVAGSGVDAAPYFRIFNPVLQSRKFDPEGEYIRRWVPELAALDKDTIHAPWEKKIRPKGYPEPLVDLYATRDRALQAYQQIKKRG
ncbi:MAG: deoxyribodipyrimidine photo-lyase [Hyphomicrobiales bacterium]|nr:deoxyribodipyrimidine photo-lyase [Hyphomicrobiales bacterium]